MTEETIQKLVDVFRVGASDKAAIAYAKIAPSTFYTHYTADEEFSKRIDEARHYAVIAARSIVVKRMTDKGTPVTEQVDLAKWYVEKHDIQQPVQQTNTQVNVFALLKEKYTKKNGQVHDITVEEKHD